MTLHIIVSPDTSPDGEPGFFSICPELDIASQGDTVEEARRNAVEAVSFFLEDADPQELARRLAAGAQVTELELAA